MQRDQGHPPGNALSGSACNLPVDVHVWWLDPFGLAAQEAELSRLLSPEEQARGSRYPDRSARLSHLGGCLLVRLGVAHLRGAPAGQVRVERHCPTCGASHGPVSLPGSGLAASVSHSGKRVLVALSSTGPVGVDVEELGDRTRTVATSLLERACSEGERALVLATAPGEQGRAFLVLWTAKEAVLKAAGQGLVGGLRTVQLASLEPPRLGPGDGPATGRGVVPLDVGPEHVAALAVSPPGATWRLAAGESLLPSPRAGRR